VRPSDREERVQNYGNRMAPLQVVERLFSEERVRSYDDAIFVGIDEAAGHKGKASKGNRSVAVTNSTLDRF